jgi:tRNA-binding EMAP/Myf-like protein
VFKLFCYDLGGKKLIKRINFKINILFILISLGLTIILFGPENFKFTNINWITYKDTLIDQLAWKFFYNDNWHFPLGKNPNYGIEIGNSIVFTGAVPFLSIIFKIFKNFLPNNFQFFSFWIFLCFFLQLLFSYLIVYHFTQNKKYSIISSFFFILSPILFYRIPMHISLVGQWIILASFFAETITKKKIRFYYWISILAISPLIHFYFTVMLSLIYFIIVFDRFLIEKKFSKSLKEISAPFFSLLLVMYLSGYFEISLPDSLGYGYGYYKANILSFFNPAPTTYNFSWSNFIPMIQTSRGEYEGFGYLGLGGIILFIFLLFNFIKREPLLGFKKNRPYYLLVIIFFTLAISNTINFGSFVLLDTPLPKFLYAPLSVIRASGRFIWPIYYLILIVGLILIYKKHEKKRALLILIIILCIQIIDISSGLKNYINSNVFMRHEKVMLNDPIWNKISKEFQIIRTTYPNNNSKIFPQMTGILLNGNFKKTDIIELARYDRNKASKYRNKTYENFRKNKLEKNTVFIIDNKNHLRNLKFLLKESNSGFFFRNKLWILIPNYKNKMSKNDRNEFNNIDFIEIFPGKEKKLYLYDEESIIGFGWTHDLNNIGVWTEGKEANILFKFRNHERKDYKLKFKIKSAMTNNIDKLNLHIKLDGKLVKKISFDRFNNKDNKFIDINLKQENLIKELHKVDFIIDNPVSPLSLLESSDGRELGILLESIEINHLN